jgi:hypothetical protein
MPTRQQNLWKLVRVSLVGAHSRGDSQQAASYAPWQPSSSFCRGHLPPVQLLESSADEGVMLQQEHLQQPCLMTARSLTAAVAASPYWQEAVGSRVCSRDPKFAAETL